METMVDQIQKNFKCPPDEDAYRLIVALLNDGLAYVGRMPGSYAQDVKLPAATEANITRFAETILPAHIRKSFEADFVVKKPTMHEYIQKLRRWRDKFEEKLDRRPQQGFLESYSPHLSEFRFLKFDEVEVPGQYLLHKDKNQDFVRIDRFLPDVDLVRGIGVCHRRSEDSRTRRQCSSLCRPTSRRPPLQTRGAHSSIVPHLQWPAREAQGEPPPQSCTSTCRSWFLWHHTFAWFAMILHTSLCRVSTKITAEEWE